MNRSVAVAIVLTGACIAAGVAFVDWNETLRAFAGIHPGEVVAALGLVIMTLLIFAIRWRILLDVEGKLPIGKIFRFMMIGYMANAMLPARPGDLIRVLLLRRQGWVGASQGLASVVLEKLFDALVICLLAVGLWLAVDLPPVIRVAANTIGAAGIVLVFLLMAFHSQADRIASLPDRLPRLFGSAIARFSLVRLGRFSNALRVIHSPARMIIGAALSLAGWACLVLSVALLLKAFRIDAGFGAAVLVVVSTNLGAAIPSSPGAVGVFHFLAVLALSFFGVGTSKALAFAIGTHALVIGLHVLLGLGSAWLEGVAVGRLNTMAAEDGTQGASFPQTVENGDTTGRHG